MIETQASQIKSALSGAKYGSDVNRKIEAAIAAIDKLCDLVGSLESQLQKLDRKGSNPKAG